MKKDGLFVAILSTCLLVAPVAFAGEVAEQEPNNPISYSAQRLPEASEILIKDAIMGSIDGGISTTDLDFYSFYGQIGDVVTFDIVGGITGIDPVDTVMAVFGPAPDYRILRMNDDDSNEDSLIRNFSLPATDTYTVGVSSFPRFFEDGGGTRNMNSSGTWLHANGDYSLLITGVTDASAKQVNIEVKPGDDSGWAPINPRSRGKIPVAILSTSIFDALTVDASSLHFGSTGEEDSLAKCGKKGEDVNGDGMLDLVCHFNNQAAGFKLTDEEGILKGSLKDGTDIEGRAPLKVIPVKGRY